MGYKQILFILAGLLSAASASAGVWTPVDNSYVLTFDDEFNGNAVNTNKWGKNWLSATGAISKPVNSAEIGAFDPAQCTVANGNLQMTAIQKQVVAADGKTYQYVSCLLNSLKGAKPFLQAYGYFEARMYLPGAAGKIVNWPAFWTNGDHSKCGSWPCGGEMDVMEGLSGRAGFHFHSPSTNAGGYPSGDFTGWHIFAALWEPGLVTYFYDGKQVGQSTTGVTSVPMYLIVNNAISPENQYGGPMQIPATVLVDYVHVYSRDPAAVAVTPEANYGGPGDTGGGVVTDITPPSIPGNVAGNAVSTSQIDLKWSASTDDVGVIGYYVYRDGVKVLNPVNGMAFSDMYLNPATTYSYQIAAYDAAGNISAKSAALKVTTQAPPPPPPVDTTAPSIPTGLIGSAINDNQINIIWTASTDAVGVAGYHVYRDGVKLANSVVGASFLDSSLKVGNSYLYEVDAFDAAGNTSAKSASLKVTIKDASAPSVPQALAAAVVSSSQINLSWQAAKDNLAVAGYYVYRNGIQVAANIVNPNFSDTNLSANTSYSYVVAAYDAAGNISAKSNAISATTLPIVQPPVSSVAVLNPGFESGGANWKYYGVARVEKVDPHSGAASAYIEKNSGFEQVVKGLQPNTSYTLSAYMKVTASSSMVSIGVKDFGASQVAKSTSSSSYVLMSVTFKTGSSNTSAKIFFWGNAGKGRADDYQVVKNP